MSFIEDQWVNLSEHFSPGGVITCISLTFVVYLFSFGFKCLSNKKEYPKIVLKTPIKWGIYMYHNIKRPSKHQLGFV